MPGSSRPKQHHYIPRHYLRGLCAEASPDRLFVYSKGSDRVFRTGTHSIAKEKGFYLDEIERVLGELLEARAEVVLKKLRLRDALDHGDREVLSAFVVNLQRRVPSFRDVVMAMIPEQQQEAAEKVRRFLENDSDLNRRQERLAELDELQEKWRNGPPADLVHRLVQPATTGTVERHLLKMHWYFCYADGPSCFVTCDNPVFTFSWGLDKADSELSCPLARHITLIATATPRTWAPYGDMPDKVVREINRRSIKNAKNQVYYCREADWLKEMVLKPHLRLNRLASDRMCR